MMLDTSAPGLTRIGEPGMKIAAHRSCGMTNALPVTYRSFWGGIVCCSMPSNRAYAQFSCREANMTIYSLADIMRAKEV
ncbi:hypothetical protein [Trinickia acidisoli]|uniref:hypothetical protein n=1 Tax=Trinickia acidisoli TaxID=2767482 RepID=UPI001A8DAA7F|nr:hypothetical protein [Trinickia acidisoli]